MQLKNVIYNYFLIAYNIFICIKKITQKKKSSSECDAKNESPYFATRAWAYRSTKYFSNFNFLVSFFTMMDSIY
jgi:hypothetical protein